MTSSERAIVSPAAAEPSLSVSASPDQLAVLRSLGCTHAQGYLIGAPAPFANIGVAVQRTA